MKNVYPNKVPTFRREVDEDVVATALLASALLALFVAEFGQIVHF